MSLRRIASVPIGLGKCVIVGFATMLLVAPAVAQTSRDELMRGFFEQNARQRRLDASIAEAQRRAKQGAKPAERESDPASTPVEPADPAAWGVLAKLAGNRWQTADGVVRVFEWSSDGQELLEFELIGGVPRPMSVFLRQDQAVVQHECLIGFETCVRFEPRFGTVAEDGSILFKEIVAVGRGKVPSVALRERPLDDWKQWKKKYLLVGERLSVYQLVAADQLEVTQSFSGKWTADPAEAPWGASQALPSVAYSRAGDWSAEARVAATGDFGPMEHLVGQRLISEDWSEILVTCG
jgi:hypothetical protein